MSGMFSPGDPTRPILGYGSGGRPSPGISDQTPPRPVTSVRGQKLSDQQLMQLLYQVGFRGESLVTAFAIAKAESGGDAGAHNPNASTGDDSYGLFQINMLGNMGPERRRQFGLSSNDDLFDPVTNARIAFQMSNGGTNWSPWSVHPASRSRGGAGSGYERHVDAGWAALEDLENSGALGSTEFITGPGGSGGGGPSGGGGMGGGGQQSFVSDQGAPPQPDPRTVEEIIAEDFGYLAWAMEHEELGPILHQAAEEGWSGTMLSGAVMDTQWWESTSIAQRMWQRLNAEDPGEAARQLEQRTSDIGAAASRLGLRLDDAKLGEIAETALSLNWSDAEIERALAAELRFNPMEDQQGLIGHYVDTVMQTSNDYLVPMGSRSAFEWAQRIAAGQETEEGVTAYMQDLARGRFPHLRGAIDSGVTPSQYFAPYRELAAERLEMAPGGVDLFRDPRFTKALDPVEDGPGKMRTMTLGEFDRHLRSLEDWNFTREANAQASQVGQHILQTFGAVKR